MREGEANAYNVLTLERKLITIEVRSWDGSRFSRLRHTTYDRADDGWHPRERVDPGSVAGDRAARD
jgi:hypothetical protein